MSDQISADSAATQLSSLLEYDPESGEFTWKVARGSRKAGDRCGSIHTNGYRMVRLGQRAFLLHRVAFVFMTGAWPQNDVDHVNGDRLDNRWENLRDVAHRINLRNQGLGSANHSGVIGVHWCKLNRRWNATIVDLKGKKHHLGSFRIFEDAVEARLEAERKYGYHENHGQRPSEAIAKGGAV